MKKFLILIINLHILFLYSCSTEEGAKHHKETEREEQQFEKKEEPKEKISEKKEEKVKEEENKLSKEEEDIYKKYITYPWELLKNPKFKSLYIKALGDLANVPWIRNISAVAGKNKVITINGRKYIYITFCKPHFCDTEMVYLLYSPTENKLFGVYLVENDYDFVKIPIDNPSEEDLKILAEAVDKDINSFVKGKVILNSPTLTPTELGIKKLNPCPILKKVVFLNGNDEKVKSITEKIYKQFIKEENINLNELNEMGLNLTLENFLIALTDLNGDRRKDVVFIVNSPYMCGTGGCPAFAYINLRKKYKSVNISVLFQNMDYFYLSKRRTNGYKDLIVNDELILKYNGSKYVVGGKCYVK